MSVYYKKKDGSIAKVAGHLTQRVNNRWFLCTRTLENGQEYYDVPDDQTKNYFEDISPFTIYAFGFAQPNATTTPKLRYKSKVYDILDLTGIEGMSVGIAQLQGVFQMFTQESEQDMTMYFLGDLHKDYGIIQATATTNQGDPSLPANVDVNVTKTEDGNILGFVFDNIKGQTGPQGEVGPQGEIGPQGPIGPTGLTALSYQQVIGDVPTEQEVLSLIPSAFNRTPQVGESIYVLAANRYFTLLTIQSVSTSEVIAIVVNVSDLQGPEGPKGDQGDAPNIVIEQINVNNTPVPVVNKTVSLTIPTAVSELNNDSNFATQEFVNSSIQAQAANFITPTAAGDTPWESFTALQTATTYYNAGVVVTLSNNDYAIFIKQEDDSHTSQWRAVYQNGQWMEQYKVGSVLTAAQQAAIDSGITSILVAQINTNKNNISKLNTNLGNYLPLIGGNLSGKVKFTGTNFLSATNSQGNESNVLSYDNTTNALKFGDANWSKITVLNSLVPDTTNTKDLGATTLRYKNAYVEGNIYTNGSIYKGTNNLQLPNKPGTVALVSDITESAQTLTDAINSEATARENAINSEATARENADNVLEDSKQDKLISGTNIKTIGGQNIVGSGNITAAQIGALVEGMNNLGQDSSGYNARYWFNTQYFDVMLYGSYSSALNNEFRIDNTGLSLGAVLENGDYNDISPTITLASNNITTRKISTIQQTKNGLIITADGNIELVGTVIVPELHTATIYLD